MKPYPFQHECLREGEAFNGRVLFALDTGLGKTPLTWWYLWRNLETVLPAIVIAPASTKYQWARSCEEILNIKPLVLEGESGEAIPEDTQIAIVNFDILSKSKRKIKRNTSSSWLDELLWFDPQTVILDEVQFCSITSKRGQACLELCQDRKYVIGLSATPLLNRPIELWPILHMIRPDKFPSRLKFARRYCSPRYVNGKWEYKGSSHEKELNRLLLKTCMVRRKKLEVLKDFPEKVRNVVVVPIENRQEYLYADSDFLGWLKEKNPYKYEKVKTSSSLGYYKIGELMRLCSRLKLKFVNEWITEFLENSNEKITIFAHHKAVIKSITKTVPFPSIVIDGSVVGKKRMETVDRFVDDNDVRMAVCNTKAVGTGTDGLQRASNHAVFVELPWQPGSVTQASDRLWRIGQTKKVWVWFLVSAGTIEERMCRLLQEKQEILSAILDGKKMDGDLDIFSQLMQEMRK